VVSVAFESFRCSRWLPRLSLVPPSLLPWCSLDAHISILSSTATVVDHVCILSLCDCLDVFPQEYRYSSTIELAARYCIVLLFVVPPFYIHRWKGFATCSSRCFTLGRFSCAHRSPLSSSDSRGAPYLRQRWISKIGSASTAFGWSVLVFPLLLFSAPTRLCRSLSCGSQYIRLSWHS